MRALRVDKMTLAALEATLRLALDPDRGRRRIPLWAFLNAPSRAARGRAGRLAEAFRAELGLDAAVVESTAFLGGGSAPVEPIPTAAVADRPPFPAPCGLRGGLGPGAAAGRPAGRRPGPGRGRPLRPPRRCAESRSTRLLDAVRPALSGSERLTGRSWTESRPGRIVDVAPTASTGWSSGPASARACRPDRAETPACDSAGSVSTTWS